MFKFACLQDLEAPSLVASSFSDVQVDWENLGSTQAFYRSRVHKVCPT